MNSKYLSILFVLLPFMGFSQKMSQKLIFTDDNDSTILKAESVNFDKEGNYLIELKKTYDDKNYYFCVRNKDTIGPLKFKSSSSVSKFSSVDKPDIRYYKTNYPRLFGPVMGEDISNFRLPESKNAVHVAVPCLQNDKIVIYFDGEIIHTIDTLSGEKMTINGKKAGQLATKMQYFRSDDWMYIDNDGNHIYSFENKKTHDLYLNGTSIDQSENSFYQARVNANKDYIYAKGREPRRNEPYDYSYMFFLHTKDSAFGPVRTAWKVYLKENGAYYLSGDDAGPDYILINDKLHKNIEAVSNITLIDKTNYLFTFTQNEQQFVHVNGNSHPYKYEKVFYPTLDENGNFAFYGLRDYYLYKFVNGKEIKEPISKFNIRPIPLYISPTGESIHVFETEDSTYIYRDENLLFAPFSSQKSYSVKTGKDLFKSAYDKNEPKNGNSLFYLEIDSTGYLIYNGMLSKPMDPVKPDSWSSKDVIGEIIAGEETENDFYLIQKTGENSYHVNINNAVYQEINDVSKIFHENCFFDGKELVFFGAKGLSFYQFKIKI